MVASPNLPAVGSPAISPRLLAVTAQRALPPATADAPEAFPPLPHAELPAIPAQPPTIRALRLQPQAATRARLPA